MTDAANLKIFVGTYNLGGQTVNSVRHIRDWLMPSLEDGRCDFYCISIQESPKRCCACATLYSDSSFMKMWKKYLYVALGEQNYDLVYSATFGVQNTCIFVAKHIRQSVSVGADNNKRLIDYTKSCRSFTADYVKSSCGSDPKVSAATDLFAIYDFIFWSGDMNSRLENVTADQAITQLLFGTLCISNLVPRDQIYKSLTNKGPLFENFKEPAINFLPSYKFAFSTSSYDFSRLPGYTDRILYWNKTEDTNVVPLEYDSMTNWTFSDHKPVYCVFNVSWKEKSSSSRVT